MQLKISSSVAGHYLPCEDGDQPVSLNSLMPSPNQPQRCWLLCRATWRCELKNAGALHYQLVSRVMSAKLSIWTVIYKIILRLPSMQIRDGYIAKSDPWKISAVHKLESSSDISWTTPPQIYSRWKTTGTSTYVGYRKNEVGASKGTVREVKIQWFIIQLVKIVNKNTSIVSTMSSV